MKKYQMNKSLKLISVFLLTVVLLFVFTACNKSENNSEINSDDVEQKNDIEVNDKLEDEEQNKVDDTEVVETFLDENGCLTNQDSIEVVVNKERNLSEDYVPGDLVTLTDVPTCLSNPEVNQLRKNASDALKKMFDKALEEINIQLYARSGYRSYKTQVSLYNGYVQNHGQEAADKFSAKPGQSEHQTGLSMDITSDNVNLQLTEDFGETEEGKWVEENAHRFGFIIRYPEGKEDVTGYMYEPWHVRYVGEELAKKVYESGFTLEEYFFGE